MKTKKGTTLIEALVFLFVFSVITVTFYSAWSLGTRYILLSKNRLVASALANEKMEVVRNLAFEDVALTTGIPPFGNLLQDEDIVRSGGTYHVHTQIANRDDPFDGTLLGDTAGGYVDYKDVKITVSWGDMGQSVSSSSRFVPAGIEQPNPGTGVLVVNVTSDKDGGALVSGASVRIQNSSLGYDETNPTDSMGRLMIVGIPAAIKEYVVTVSKSGYETVQTLPPSPTSPYNPTHEHASVVELAINTANIYQNKLANLIIKTKDNLGADAAGINFALKGGRVLGTDTADPTVKIYNTDVTDSTDGSGEKDFGDVSPGSYFFELKEAGYTLTGMDHAATLVPALPNEVWEYVLAPDESTTLSIKVSSDAATVALFKVRKDSDSMPISGASVHLTNATIPYDKTIPATDAIGYAFFPDDATPLVAGTYDYTVSATGFIDATGQVTVSGGAIETETVSMTAF